MCFSGYYALCYLNILKPENVISIRYIRKTLRILLTGSTFLKRNANYKTGDANNISGTILEL